MNRRSFVEKSALAALAIPFVSLSSCKPNTTEVVAESFALEETTVAMLQEKMKSGELTAKAIAEMYLQRIEKFDKGAEKLNSVIEVNPDAVSVATQLDDERKAGKTRGPLHGIPVLIKDNIDTSDKMLTTAGSIALNDNHATKDAFIIARLREAGAVILGKTNLSEWANFRSERSASGWSSRGGQTKNPYDFQRNACGSSSGSGAAVSANLCAIAIGTETNGSILCPSSVNGVVGIKPTVGLWSRSGIIPISATQDTAGPMARTVADAAVLLGALIGVDSNDAITTGSEGKAEKDYTKYLEANGLKGRRIGIEKSYLKVHEAVDALLQKAIEQMKAQGAEIVEVDFLSKTKGIGDAEYLVLQYEFKDGLNKYLAGANSKIKTLKDLIEFNKSREGEAMPYFKQEILEKSEARGTLDDKEYKEALSKILTTTKRAVEEVMTKEKLDAISGPTYGPSWCIDLVNGDYGTGYGFSGPTAIAGFPHITVPMGFVFGLPIGLSFFGRAYSEGELIRLAYAYEQASKNRKAPKL